MKILYLFSLLILFSAILILKKNDKKENILISIVYTSGILIFYNILIGVALNAINMKNTLLMLFIIYLITAAILVLINLKKYKKIKYQKFYLDKKQLICFLIIFIVCLSLGFIRTEGFKVTDYIVTDGSTHYSMAQDYSNCQKLLYQKECYNEMYNFGHTMPGYYINNGIFMQVMPFKTYISYNIFNTLIFCLLGLAFYVTCLKIKKTDKRNILTLIVTLLYTLAYPLNYFIYGFGYLGLGILASNLILLTWYMLDEDYKQKGKYICLAMFNFGLFFSYYLFVPVIFLAEALYMIYVYMTKKYTFKEMFIYGVISLLIPTIMGALFFLLSKDIQAGTEVVTEAYQTEGYLYKNLWGNFILIFPLIIFSIINQIKSKKITFDTFFLVIILIFIFYTLYLATNQKISSYYYYKPYNILWLIFYIYIFRLVNINNKEASLYFKIIIGFLLVVITLGCINIENRIFAKNSNVTYTNLSGELGSIYKNNYDEYHTLKSIRKDDLQIFEAAIKNKKKCNVKNRESEIPVQSGVIRKTWFYSTTGINSIYKHRKKQLLDFQKGTFDYEKIRTDDNIKCIVIFDPKGKKDFEINYDEYNILYKNKVAVLLQKK